MLQAGIAKFDPKTEHTMPLPKDINNDAFLGGRGRQGLDEFG